MKLKNVIPWVSLRQSANVFWLWETFGGFADRVRCVSCEVLEDALEHQRQLCLFFVLLVLCHFVLRLTSTWQCGTTEKHIVTGGKNKLVGGTNFLSTQPHFTKWRKMKATVCPIWWVMNHTIMNQERTVFLWNKATDQIIGQYWDMWIKQPTSAPCST